VSPLSKIFLVLALPLIFATASCSGQHSCFGDPFSCKPYPPASNKVTPEENLRFAKFKSTVIDTYCLRCHNPQKAKKGVDLSSLDSILSRDGLVVPGDPINSDLYFVVLDNSMPPRTTLDESVKEKIRLWILGLKVIEESKVNR
jgi:hypothetical protein